MVHYIFPPIVKNSLYDEIGFNHMEQDYGSDSPIQRKEDQDIFAGFDPYHNYFPIADITNDEQIEEITR